jgi:transcriptional regulator with XRE-family HTH domain
VFFTKKLKILLFLRHQGAIIHTKEVILMHIGDRIKARRLALGWSQRDLAARMGYKNHSAITRTEAGTVDLSQSRVEQFAKVLDTTPGYLMGWVSEDDSKKNNELAKLVVRLRTDNDFYNTVTALAALDEKEYRGVSDLVAALHK